MKLSFLTYLFCRYPLEYSFKMASEYGFHGIEIWGARPHAYAYDMNKKNINDILNWKEKYNIEISMHTPEIIAYPYNLISSSRKVQEDTIEYLIENIKFTAAIGCNRMQITVPHSTYDVSKEEKWNYLIKNLNIICEKAQSMNINILVEPLTPSEGNLITSVDDLVYLIEEIDNDNLLGMLDLIPPIIANEPFSEYFIKLGDKMDYIHIANSNGIDEKHLKLDSKDGIISIKNSMNLFNQYNYSGWLSLELLDPYFKDPELYLSESAKIIKNNIKDFGG